MSTKAKSDKKDRQRKSAQNLSYKGEHRHEKSHVRRIMKHLARFPRDKVAVAALTTYRIAAGLKPLAQAAE